MIEMNHKRLSLRAQCRLLDVNRNRLNPKQNKKTSEDELIMRSLDEIHTAYPFYGQRNLQYTLLSYGWKIGRKRVRRLMKLMDISSLAPQPNTRRPKKEHKKYPYLLRNLTIDRADQVWCADISYGINRVLGKVVTPERMTLR